MDKRHRKHYFSPVGTKQRQKLPQILSYNWHYPKVDKSPQIKNVNYKGQNPCWLE
jgi:hypothetical protein